MKKGTVIPIMAITMMLAACGSKDGSADLSVKDGEDLVIDAGGTYTLSGSAKNASVRVEAGKNEVRLILDGLDISNEDKPCIYIKSADKVFLSAGSQKSSLGVSGKFREDGENKGDAAIFSKSDLILEGTGSISIVSSKNGITGRESVRINGPDLEIDCGKSAVEARDSIRIEQGKLDAAGCHDGLHAEDSDDTKGSVFLSGGSVRIQASDDAVHATMNVEITGGEIELSGREGIEGTVIKIGDGTVNISASDDGINAAHKSKSVSPLFELNGGNVTINMEPGDTDGVDSNGDIRINGGTISITASHPFDYDGNAEYNGGSIFVNGEKTDEITR